MVSYSRWNSRKPPARPAPQPGISVLDKLGIKVGQGAVVCLKEEDVAFVAYRGCGTGGIFVT
ncbi:MAG: hypothetical protein R3E89_18785 [Thiolinea sp.]